jgi:uncharacterized protein YbbK (DUF523 family)
VSDCLRGSKVRFDGQDKRSAVLIDSVKVYADAEASSPEREQGAGLFAAALMRTYPDLPIEDDDRLQDARVRASFVERVFAYARQRAAR